MGFKLPETLPSTVAELDELKDKAQREINVIQARHEAGEDLSKDDVARLRELLDADDALDAARAEAQEAEQAHAAEVTELLGRAKGASAEAEDAETDTDEGGEDATDEAAAEVVAEAEKALEGELVAAGADKRPVKFSGRGGDIEAPKTPEGPGWEMVPGAPNFTAGRIGFGQLAQAIESVTPGSRRARGASAQVRGSYFSQGLARLKRDVDLIEDSHALVAAITKVTTTLPDGTPVTAASLTAAGGWCAPSEQLYDFCDVPDAVDLLSLPEITINRGGVRWPIEPDLTAIFESFQFFFTEPELEAEDAEGNPTAVKECVDIPCPDEFEELRLNAVGYCVEAGILQTQGWPELIEWFMRHLAAEHLRAISRRSILDMVAGSTLKTIPADSQIAAASSVLNSLALQATNLRLHRGLARNATIEGVAPSWLAEVLRADLANQEGVGTKSVSDAQVNQWLVDRNIALQYVGDWQTRATGQPGHLDTVEWPATVDVLLYPAGTWFRAMANVIEIGIMYPKEQLQVNRYTRFFTEDAIAIGKRCNQSLVVRVPICPSGAIGPRQAVDCATPVTP